MFRFTHTTTIDSGLTDDTHTHISLTHTLQPHTHTTQSQAHHAHHTEIYAYISK